MPRQPKNFLKDIVYEIFQELYANSDPPLDFRKAEEEAEWCYEKGFKWIPISEKQKEEYKNFTSKQMLQMGFRKQIDFDSYKIPEAKFAEIVQSTMDKYKKKLRKIDRERIRATVYLGPSPHIIYDENLHETKEDTNTNGVA